MLMHALLRPFTDKHLECLMMDLLGGGWYMYVLYTLSCMIVLVPLTFKLP